MTHHILACALCASNPNSGANWAWTALGFAVFGVGAMIAGARDQKRRKAGLPPRPPRADVSPALMELLSGQRQDAYTAPVNTVNPSGIRVRHARCCPGGHRSPEQAVAHARSVEARIGVHGR